MSKPKKRPLSKEEKLAKDRLRKREKYLMIKNNAELYAVQKEKERKRYLLRKEQKKICSISDMTPRAQRHQRKKWRKNSLRYLEKKREVQRIERIIVDNSPPPSELENMDEEEIIEVKSVEGQDPLKERNYIKPIGNSFEAKKIIRRMRYRHTKIVQQFKNEIKKLQNEIKTLKTLNNDHNSEKMCCDTVEKKVQGLLQNIQGEKVEEVKKKLLFGEYVSKNLKEEYKVLEKKNKKPFVDRILKNRNKFKEHQILNEVPFPYRKKVQNQKRYNPLPNKIRCFLEDDANSSLAAGKKEFVKSNGIKRQKRYLRDNLESLHEKFCKDEIKVGYSTFCRYRPSWIVFPNTRETCGCKLHTNVDLLIEALKKANITKEGSNKEILKSICCNINDENCLDKTCQRCKNKTLEYKEFNNDEKITFYQWLVEKQTYKDKDGKEKTATVTIKKKLEDYPRNIIIILESMLEKFLIHVKNISVQYRSIKELKQKLKPDEILIHIDFSENYCLKYNTEIQAFHFGGSRGQVSLHTVVLYYINCQTDLITTQSFCSISKCVKHDAKSVWAHLDPVLATAKELVPDVRLIHFLSDSPTSQYRNKYIFYMMTRLNEKVPNIDTITWNYQEAGHGKGAPDGIGAVLKRTADDFVKHGEDVGSFEDFVRVVSQNVKNVRIEVVEEDKILNTEFPQNIPSFKGTMNVHQVIWCRSLPHSVAFRKLSCFICKDSYVPCFHNRHLGVLSIGMDGKTTCQTQQVEYENPTSPSASTSNIIYSHPVVNEMTDHIVDIDNSKDLICNVIQNYESDTYEDTSYLNLDSPTILNNITNIDDNVLLNAIDDQAFLRDSKNATPQPNNNVNDTLKSPRVTILSNIPFDWQRYSFYNKKSRAFNQCDQEEFKKFISDSTSFESKSYIDTSNTVDVISTHNEIDINICNTAVDYVNQTEIDSMITSHCEDNKENFEKPRTQDRNIGDWVIVQYKIKSKLYSYIGKITEFSNGTFTILFLKKTSSSNTFSWPAVVDEDIIEESRIVYVLPMPEINRRGLYYFHNLPNLVYK